MRKGAFTLCFAGATYAVFNTTILSQALGAVKLNWPPARPDDDKVKTQVLHTPSGPFRS
ncbi:hypothetical protein P389DRAFT_171467 [Cystobasidium minutum MCA 4210]|uniref:uncharacterized protein n=1 Tax=Cystobasidium minutum MCA 4210 TaxID=1397322 RepID=UPI0034CDBB60|eukprot:jgi/Rhomi1/171467/fgenesh1_kg.4_\